MDLRETIEKYKQFKVPSLSVICEKASQYSKTCLLVVVIFVVFLALALQYVPQLQVAQFGITNPKDLADAENSYRATLAQILGGIAIGIGLYYTWRRISIAEDTLRVTQEGQITERFTRAVDQLGAIDQLGNPAIEIRLGGIYALERIADESEKDRWPIKEILTAYVRKNSNADNILNEESKPSRTPLDIQAIITVLGKHKYVYNNEEFECINLSKTYLNWLTLNGANLERTDFTYSYLQNSHLEKIHFEHSDFSSAHLEVAELFGCNLEGACFENGHFEGAGITKSNLKKIFSRDAHLEKVNLYKSNLERAYLVGANLKGAFLLDANFEGADLEGADLEEADLAKANFNGAYLKGANLKGVKGLTIDQLSKVRTLYNAELNEELKIQLKEKYPALFEKPHI